jgi:hypothetical protein
MKNDPYKVTYNFTVEHENVDLIDHPRNSLTTLSFDGTDAPLGVVVGQFETFLKAAGYYFDHLDIVKDSYLK